MPREQETSLPHDPATSDDPLFREPSGRHATARDDDTLPGDAATDAPGEWVAGNKGPDYSSADDTVDPAGSNDPADLDRMHSGPTRPTDFADTEDPAGATSTTGTTGTAADLRSTRDPAVAPDSALAAEPDTVSGTEPTRADDATTLPPTGASTPADGIPPVDATTPVDTSTPADTTHNGTAPATTGTPVPGAPGTAETTGVDVAAAAFVTNGEELHADWARIQSSFVDDPRQAVSQAADLVGQVTRSLVTAVQEREQTLRGSWESQDGTDTEHLRNALRDYRAYFELLVKL